VIRFTVLVLAGCNSILGLGDVRARQQDAKQFLDAPPPSCTMPTSSLDAFDDDVDPPCSTWGFVHHEMCTTTVMNSELVMTSDPLVTSEATRCGCGALSAIAFEPNIGTFLQMFAPPAGPLEYLLFYAHWEGGPSSSLIAWGGGMLHFQRDSTELGMIAYDPSTPWWRIRPTDDRGAIAAEVSADAIHWTEFARDPVAAPAEIRVELVTGTFPIGGNPGEDMPSTVRVEGIDVCP
jgi:hypothetical protein